jgi:hypothetical protein
LVRTVIASDLDRTLIYSGSALQLPGEDADAPSLLSVEVLEGRPHSFMTLTTARRLQQIAGAATFVPTTTRTVAQYRRVRLAGIAPSYAVTSNGGNILIDGVPDADWNASLHAAVAASGTTLDTVKAELKARSDPEWMLKRRTGDDLFCYAVVEPSLLPSDWVPAWREWCAERGWAVSVQARKVYAIPAGVSKERALQEVCRRAGATRMLASGDGALDAGFLSAADAGIRPPHGELATMNWQHPTVRVAPRPGVLAADDMTGWFATELGIDTDVAA